MTTEEVICDSRHYRNLDDLLTDLTARGVLIEAHGDKLRIAAPAGALTANLRQALAEHKAAILAQLAGETKQPAEPEIHRIPLGWGRWTAEHGGDDLHDWLEAHGLRAIGGTPYFGGAAFRPMLFVADITDPEVAT